MDATERDLFADAVRRATDAHVDDARALDGALEELGWHDALAADPRLAVPVLFESLGASNATSSALDAALRAGLGLADERGVVAVLPPLGGAAAPGTVTDTESVGGDTVSVRGIATRSPEDDTAALVVAATTDGNVAATVEANRLSFRRVEGMDPRLGLATVAGTLPASLPRAALAPGAWASAVDLVRLALGHELVGAAGAMLELARDHALERVQFDRPIGAFQAVRHRLADTLVAVEGARALLDAAWEDGSSATIAMAKATAARAARVSARHCQQVLAGMGFTTEHRLHRYVRRVLVLDELFGSARALTRGLGDDLLAGGPLPAPIPL